MMKNDSFIGRSFHSPGEQKAVFINVTIHKSDAEKIVDRSLSDEEMQRLADAVAEGLFTHYEDEIEFAAEMLQLRP